MSEQQVQAAPKRLPFATYDVFTTTRYQGNPLAVVESVGANLTPEQKQTIAKEFDYSETVFINSISEESEGDTAGVKVHEISILTPYREIPFAGHPTIGTSFHILNSGIDGVKDTVLIPLAGKITAAYDPTTRRVRLKTPHAITLHDKNTASHERMKTVLTGLDTMTSSSSPYGEYSAKSVPLLSIVKHFTFALAHISSLDVLGNLFGAGPGQFLTPQKDLNVTNPPPVAMICIYCYVITGGSAESVEGLQIRTRMFFEGVREDPATGSAACSLAAYLSIQKANASAGGNIKHGEKGPIRYRYDVTQGVEMGRESRIHVEVTMKQRSREDGGGSAIGSTQEYSQQQQPPQPEFEVDEIYLEGAAVKIMEGILEV